MLDWKQFYNETVLSEVSVWNRMSSKRAEGQELQAEC